EQRFAGRDRMRTMPADQAQRLRGEAVDLNPKHVERRQLAQNLEVTFGLGVEVEVEQQIDVRAGALADGFQMQAQILEKVTVDVELGIERAGEARAPAFRVLAPRLIQKDIGLERTEAALAHFPADRLDAVEIADGGLVVARMIDAPGGTVGPVDANAVANLAAEQLVAGHAERLRLGIQQGILDGTQ